jgi:hypothetical protein
MLLDDKAVIARLNSPLNLINKIASGDLGFKRKGAMQLFTGPDKSDKPTFNPFKKNPSSSSSLVQPVASKDTEASKDMEHAEASNESDSIRLEDVIENADSQIQLAHAHDSALKLINNSIRELSTKLPDIKADRLPAVMLAAGKIVESIRKERAEVLKRGINNDVHFHFYTPQQKELSEYEIIDVVDQVAAPVQSASG